MDNVQNIPGTEPTPIPAPAPAPAPVPAPAPAPAPVPTPVSSFAEVGMSSSGNPIKKFFENVSFTDVGMILLATASFGFVIYYYREKIKQAKKEAKDTRNKLDELESNLKTVMGANYKSFS